VSNLSIHFAGIRSRLYVLDESGLRDMGAAFTEKAVIPGDAMLHFGGGLHMAQKFCNSTFGLVLIASSDKVNSFCVGPMLAFLSMHDWLLHLGAFLQWIALRLQGPGIFLVAIADSSFLSLPEGNDLLIVMLSTNARWSHMAYYVAMTIAGSICGCLLLYTVGKKGGSVLLRKKFPRKDLERAERLFEKYGLWTVAVPSILPPPCPFKIFVLSAGVFRLKTRDFITAVIIGRTIRYSMWGILAVLYGNSVKIYMQNNLRFVGTVLFAIFIIMAAATVFFYCRRSREMRREAESSAAESSRSY
jgi:membrane protein YqaA with SNARE-associated domain